MKSTTPLKKSPLRYPGGKTRAIKFLKDFVPDFQELRDPFFGGGSFSIHFAQQYPDKKFKASDLNYELYCFWQQLKKNPTELIAKVQHIFDAYSDGRKLYKEIVARREALGSEIDRGVDFFVLNRITFSGVVDAGGYSQTSYEKRFTQSCIERLKMVAPVLQNIDFHCEDYSFLTEEEGDDVLLFFDPPYYSATKSRLYGKKGILHTQFDHEVFYETLSKTKHKWLITYDNCAFITDLYKDYHQKDWELQYGMNNYKQGKAAKGKELLIANYDLNLLDNL